MDANIVISKLLESWRTILVSGHYPLDADGISWLLWRKERTAPHPDSARAVGSSNGACFSQIMAASFVWWNFSAIAPKVKRILDFFISKYKLLCVWCPQTSERTGRKQRKLMERGITVKYASSISSVTYCAKYRELQITAQSTLQSADPSLYFSNTALFSSYLPVLFCLPLSSPLFHLHVRSPFSFSRNKDICKFLVATHPVTTLMLSSWMLHTLCFVWLICTRYIRLTI